MLGSQEQVPSWRDSLLHYYNNTTQHIAAQLGLRAFREVARPQVPAHFTKTNRVQVHKSCAEACVCKAFKCVQVRA